MTHRSYRILQIVLITGLALYLIERLASGKVLWYINERFTPLTVIGAIALVALAANTLFTLRHKQHEVDDHGHSHDEGDDDAHGHDHAHTHSPASLLWLALPLAIGLLVPARPLGADAAATKGVALGAPQGGALQGGALQGGATQASATLRLDLAPEQRSVLDWIRLFNYAPDLSPYLGQTADVIGFVYPDPRLPAGHVLVARFTVACCVADASAIGMVVRIPDSALNGETTVSDQWVRVRGPVQIFELDGHRIPLILAERIDPAAEPDQPYLFP